MNNTGDILIVKLSPLNGMNSSMLRTLALIKGLLANGREVDLLSIHESKTTIINDLSKYDFLDQVHIYYANGNATYDRLVSHSGGIKAKLVSLIRKIYHRFSLFDYTYGIAKKTDIHVLDRKEYRLVISISDPKSAHKAVRRLVKQGLTFDKWIEYWGDPMAIDITNKSIYPRFVYSMIEKKMFCNCDSIVYTSPLTLAEQKKMYPQYGNRMKYVPTAYINEKIFPEHKGVFTVGYYGAYNSYVRNIMPLYEACTLLKDDIKLTIAGNSDIELKSTENITVFPRSNVEEMEAETDLFVCIMNSSGTQIPGKVYHYAATNKPVLIILDGERREELREFFSKLGRYEICNNDREEIQRAIVQIMNKKEEVLPYKAFSCKAVADEITR